MKKVFLVHGYEGMPNGGWRPWLMKRLSKNGIYACALPMPHPSKPQKDEWVATIAQAVGDPSDEIFLVGHSLGGTAVLRYLESLGKGESVGGAVLVSTAIENKRDEHYDNVNSFFKDPFDFASIAQASKQFVVIHGDNDPDVPLKDGQLISESLSCELVVIADGGHLSGLETNYKLLEGLDVVLRMIRD